MEANLQATSGRCPVAHASTPRCPVDVFGDEHLADPWPGFEKVRETASVVYLEEYGAWAVGRHDEVTEVLKRHGDFVSGNGIGHTNISKETPWRRPSIILESDPPLHTRMRKILARVLSPSAMKKVRARVELQAELLAEDLAKKADQEIEAITEIAQVFPVRVFPDLVGVPEGGRENLLRYGQMTFNGHGPKNHLFDAAMADSDETRNWIAERCTREMLSDDGMGADIFAFVDSGDLTEDEAELLIRSFLSAGVDSTVNAFGFGIRNFAKFPEQWDALRADPSLARSAFDEIVRRDAPVLGLFRTAEKDTQIGDVTIPKGDKVLVMFASAARDPRRWEEAEDFDITRKTVGHTGFGSGIHACAGQMVARLEGESLFKALAERFERIELVGEPETQPNNTLHGLSRLPVRFHPAK